MITVFRFILVWLCLSLASFKAFAAHIVPDYSMSIYDKNIENLYQNPALKTQNIVTRIDIISGYFLGKPYLGGALGEGKTAPFDQEPIYRTDAFDCLTYVSTVLALAKANNLSDFQKIILKTQYKNANPIFVNRLHFTGLDWNKVNEENGYIRDITNQIKDSKGRSVAKMAQATINKPAWYKKMTAQNLSLITPLSSNEEKERVNALQNLSQQVHVEESNVPYIPLAVLFNSKGEANEKLFDQIPSGSIVEIVRPNWDLTATIGTNINISHLGFAIRTSKGLMFREASLIEKHVIDIPLSSYLRGYLSSPTIKGIHIEEVRS